MGIEAFILKAQQRWVGHIMRMQDCHIRKEVFLGHLAALGKVSAMRASLALQKRFEGQHEAEQHGLVSWEQLHTQDRSACRTLRREAVNQFEDSRVEALEHKKLAGRRLNLAAISARGHVAVAPELDSAVHAHQQTHRWQAIRRSDSAVHVSAAGGGGFGRGDYDARPVAGFDLDAGQSVCLCGCLSVCLSVPVCVSVQCSR